MHIKNSFYLSRKPSPERSTSAGPRGNQQTCDTGNKESEEIDSKKNSGWEEYKIITNWWEPLEHDNI